jgi:uncharacterized protein YbjT (DUF2867 family)
MIVVTGATGNVGKPLVQALAGAGLPVTAVSRRMNEAPPGVRTYQADLAEPHSLEAALDGADAVFLLTSAQFMESGDLGAVTEVVRGAGVGRIVLLSSQGVGTQRHPPQFEDAVTQSGGEWTVLRPGNFDSNTLQWAQSIRTTRTVAAPFGKVALPAIDPTDIAEVAAAVLREAGHAGKVYTLTGPEPISPREQAAAIEHALRTPLRFVEQSRGQARQEMLRFMPEPVVEATLAVLGAPSAAEQQVSPDVQRLLGRPPRTYAQWVASNVTAFA